MDPTETMKAMGELWGAGAQAVLHAQGQMLGFPAGAKDGNGTATGAAKAAQDAYEQAWTSAEAISAAFLKSLEGAGGKAEPVTADVLAKIFDPRGWLSATSGLDESMARMADGPRLADLWNVERKFSTLFGAWSAFRGRHHEHNRLMLEIWTEAAGQFSRLVRERADGEKPLGSARELMALWVETANDVLLEAQRSDRFLQSQRETLKASTDLRLAQGEVAEYYATIFGYPTRAELDDVHKSLTELRREVRALSRAKRRRAKPTGASA